MGDMTPITGRPHYDRVWRSLEKAHDACFKHPDRDRALGMSHGPFSGVNEALGIVAQMDDSIASLGKEVLALREALTIICSEFAQQHPLIVAGREALASTENTAAAIVERIRGEAHAPIISKIDEMVAALAREYEKPFTGVAWSATEALNRIRSALSPSPPALNAEQREGGA